MAIFFCSVFPGVGFSRFQLKISWPHERQIDVRRRFRALSAIMTGRHIRSTAPPFSTIWGFPYRVSSTTLHIKDKKMVAAKAKESSSKNEGKKTSIRVLKTTWTRFIFPALFLAVSSPQPGPGPTRPPASSSRLERWRNARKPTGG